ncbi:hypothetical protein C6P40_004768 [Pichia californica]|uniref:Uncharacterized protein n=1 Tax=Pichia californica TaxID=460514 RepID=A0A9P6WME4_9ASCO|nr:hypothetical protein C6P40_004768 [[Candida] californica]
MSENVQLLSSVPPEPYNSTLDQDNLNPATIISDHEATCMNDDNDLNNDEDEDVQYFTLHPVTSSTFHELSYILKNSFPVFCTFFFQYLIQILIPTYFSSQLGSIYMSSCTLSITTFYMTGPVLVNGFTSSLDTLCSTAFGARHYHKVGRYYIHCTILLLILMLPSFIFWSNSLSFFQWITNLNHNSKNDEFDSTLPLLCSSFLSIFTYVGPALIIFECTKRFLQSQCKFFIPTRIVICGIPISIILNIFFKNHFFNNLNDELNLIKGPAISFVLTYWIMTLSLVFYVLFIDGYQCLPIWNEIKIWKFKNFLNDIKILFKLGIPGILMILSEAFAFQVLTFASTNFPKSQLAAQSIIATLTSLAFQPPYAIGVCCSIHIANIIGACSSNYKPAMKAIYIIMLFMSIFNFSWFYLLRNQIAKLFTNDKEILIIVSKLAKIIAVNQLLDCFNTISAAVLRGQGRQKIGSILSIISYYILGLPLEWYWGFKLDYKIYGLWIGLAIAVNFLSIIELYIVYTSKWKSIIKRNHKLA